MFAIEGSSFRRPRSPSPDRPRHRQERSCREDRSRSRDRRDEKEARGSRRSASPSSRKRRHSRSRSPRRRSRTRSRSRDDKERRRRRSHSVSSDSAEDRDERKRRRKEKKDKKARKKDKKEKKSKSSTAQWGKYGIISESDIFLKSQEFYAYLVEERKINPETVSKETNKKEFLKFVEDYNTATLPSDKYYNIEAYEKRMAALRQGEYIPPTDDGYDANADIKAHRNTHKRVAVETESYLTREQLLELRKVQHERTEASKRKLLGMDVKASYGVRMDGNAFESAFGPG